MGLTSIDDLKGNPRNPRKITGEALAGLKVSLAMFGDIAGIVWNSRTGELVAGHQRVRGLKALYGERLKVEGEEIVAPTGERWAVRVVDWDEQTAMAALVTANNSAVAGEWDDGLEGILAELKQSDEELFAGLCLDELLPEEELAIEDKGQGSLAERFGVPPFSVLDARQGYWIERKDRWLARGIRSEEGRGDELTWSDSAQPPALYKLRNAMRDRDGKDPSWEEVHAEARRRGIKERSLTSIFDPVLCELCYRWFCPPGGLVLDPFAGGSVRGLVAGMLGRHYVGIDVRAEQVEANRGQVGELAELVSWTIGDSSECPLPEAVDFVFSCPPYGDLEVYSEHPRDISTMKAAEFDAVYTQILRRSVDRLREDRFAAIVIGNIRDKTGGYRDLVGLTIRAMESAGLSFYNDGVLVTPAASAPIRAGRSFEVGRKLTRIHQNVLVFVKGDWRRATEAVGVVEFGDEAGEVAS